MKRKVIQLMVTTATEQYEGEFLALCDDGTIWTRTYKYDRDGSGKATNHRWEWNVIEGPPEAIN